MHKEKAKHKPGFAYGFYISGEWRQCREDYLEHVGHLCERHAARGEIVVADHVHHKIRLTPQNITDPAVTLNWDNLEALCEQCHKAEHRPHIRWRCDAMGHVEL